MQMSVFVHCKRRTRDRRRAAARENALEFSHALRHLPGPYEQHTSHGDFVHQTAAIACNMWHTVCTTKSII